MRVAFFDGILESHVPDSLERALKRRGHQVLNRGKFGHGFKFPGLNQDTSKIHAEIDEILSFSPDVILVFRPALLPPEILPRFQNRGITLVAWFSDDPVLFDLSYGPVVEQYDMILHCGNRKILQYYEDFFGRATGVNFPFWTDRESFPKLWEPSNFLSDAVFLGNVQDEVRRQRYFDLGQMQHDVRVHGNVGTDYFNVWGGFLDTNLEVAHSIAKSKVAINIPQFFEDHYGLETWFPDLDNLGFFEYPSRVIQYMSVGIPPITLLPYEYSFESFPEMLVFQDVKEVDEYLYSVTLAELEDLSERVSRRFEQNFSADSRALAFEAVLADSSWRRLDAHDRAMWFTHFVPVDETKETASREIINLQRKTAYSPPKSVSSKTLSIACIVQGNYYELSTAGSIVRGLKNLGHSVTIIEARKSDGTLVPDPSYLFKYVPSVGLVQTLNSFNVAFVVGDDIGITEYGSTTLKAHAITSVKVSHAPPEASAKRLREIERFTHVFFANASAYRNAKEQSLENVHLLPPIPDRTFLTLLDSYVSEPEGAVRITTTTQLDESLAPAFLNDLTTSPRTASIEEIQSLTLDKAIEFLRGTVAFQSFYGTRNSVQPGELFPYVMAAAQLVFVPRSNQPEIYWKWLDALTQIRSTGELEAKARLVVNDPSLLKTKIQVKEGVLATCSLEEHLSGLVAASPKETTEVEKKEQNDSFYLTFDQTLPLSSVFPKLHQAILQIEILKPYTSKDVSSFVVKSLENELRITPVQEDLQLFLPATHEISLTVLDTHGRRAYSNQRPIIRVSIVHHLLPEYALTSLASMSQVGVLNPGAQDTY